MMLNQTSIQAVNDSVFSESFRKPLYDSYCFSNIPGTIDRLLTGSTNLPTLPANTLIDQTKTYRNVVLFFIDAFGWRFFEEHKDTYPTLQRFLHNGQVSKITSQFPSTTSAHVTTIHTAQRVDESGVFEWFYYEPQVDDMISPLPFAYAGEARNTLHTSGIAPEKLFPKSTFFEILRSKHIETHIFQSENFTPSTYGNIVTRGVYKTHPFSDFTKALADVSTLINDNSQQKYIYFYFGDIDAIGHEYGPASAEFATMVDTFFSALEQDFFSSLKPSDEKTLLLMTADHGQTEIDPTTTVYINQLVPEMDQWIKRNQNGKAMMPGGSARDLFVYVKEEFTSIALTTLKSELAGIAEVYLTDELLKAGLFGNNPSDLLRARLSNICILPYAHESVYWYEANKFEQTFYGHHGGLTPAEMESVCMMLEV